MRSCDACQAATGEAGEGGSRRRSTSLSAARGHMPRALRPSLFRPIKVVMTDGSTFHVPSAIRQVSKVLQLERDPANHPLYLGKSDALGMMSRREEARLEKFKRRDRAFVFDDERDI